MSEKREYFMREKRTIREKREHFTTEKKEL
jgi:hypothetical protein